ncbi:MAG: hypothetical protein LBD23_11675 [Oscillospiraceae bacterium]|jgi:hypothetical protein|nr:hypothetical protein [Oscillospiraceae bacterium]
MKHINKTNRIVHGGYNSAQAKVAGSPHHKEEMLQSNLPVLVMTMALVLGMIALMPSVVYTLIYNERYIAIAALIGLVALGFLPILLRRDKSQAEENEIIDYSSYTEHVDYSGYEEHDGYHGYTEYTGYNEYEEHVSYHNYKEHADIRDYKENTVTQSHETLFVTVKDIIKEKKPVLDPAGRPLPCGVII